MLELLKYDKKDFEVIDSFIEDLIVDILAKMQIHVMTNEKYIEESFNEDKDYSFLIRYKMSKFSKYNDNRCPLYLIFDSEKFKNALDNISNIYKGKIALKLCNYYDKDTMTFNDEIYIEAVIKKCNKLTYMIPENKFRYLIKDKNQLEKISKNIQEYIKENIDEKYIIKCLKKDLKNTLMQYGNYVLIKEDQFKTFRSFINVDVEIPRKNKYDKLYEKSLTELYIMEVLKKKEFFVKKLDILNSDEGLNITFRDIHIKNKKNKSSIQFQFMILVNESYIEKIKNHLKSTYFS